MYAFVLVIIHWVAILFYLIQFWLGLHILDCWASNRMNETKNQNKTENIFFMLFILLFIYIYIYTYTHNKYIYIYIYINLWIIYKKHPISIKNNQLSKTTFEVLNFIIGTASLFILFSHFLSRNLSRI